MIRMSYTDSNDFVSVAACLGDSGASLKEIFAKFVELTRIIGYQSGSWETLIGEIDSVVDEDYDIFDWASDNIYCDA